MEPTTLTRGEACPACGGVLAEAPVPTDAEYLKALDKENPIPLRPGSDTASPAVRAELGALSRCERCGYQARFPVEAAPATKRRGDVEV